jgi:hypothetical protein
VPVAEIAQIQALWAIVEVQNKTSEKLNPSIFPQKRQPQIPFPSLFSRELVKWEDSKTSKRSKAQRKSLKNKALRKEKE